MIKNIISHVKDIIRYLLINISFKINLLINHLNLLINSLKYCNILINYTHFYIYHILTYNYFLNYKIKILHF